MAPRKAAKPKAVRKAGKRKAKRQSKRRWGSAGRVLGSATAGAASAAAASIPYAAAAGTTTGGLGTGGVLGFSALSGGLAGAMHGMSANRERHELHRRKKAYRKAQARQEKARVNLNLGRDGVYHYR